MRKRIFSFVLCFALLAPTSVIIAQEKASSEWRWKVALGGALIALSSWVSRYFGKKPSSEDFASRGDGAKESSDFLVDVVKDFMRVRNANISSSEIADESQLPVIDTFQAMIDEKRRLAVAQERESNRSQSYFDDPESTPVRPDPQLRLHVFQLITDETLLFFVESVKQQQIQDSLDPMPKNITRVITFLQGASDKNFGEHLEGVEYLSMVKKKLESIIPEFYSAGLAKDIQEMQAHFWGQGKVYKEVKESLQYLGGYSGLLEDITTLIKQEKDTKREELQKRQENIKRRIEELSQKKRITKPIEYK